jgi:hypothetical protein
MIQKTPSKRSFDGHLQEQDSRIGFALASPDALKGCSRRAEKSA